MNRRQLLAGLSAAVAAGGVLALWPDTDPSGLFAAPDAAARVGNAYLASTTTTPTRAQLEQRLFGEAGASATFARGPEAVGRWLATEQKADFEAGRLAKVEGWMLSETEARLCALIALS